MILSGIAEAVGDFGKAVGSVAVDTVEEAGKVGHAVGDALESAASDTVEGVTKVGKAVGSALGSAASAVATGLDDYFCSWEEMFTHNRRDELEKLHSKQKHLLDGINQTISFCTSMQSNQNRVIDAVQDHLKKLSISYAINLGEGNSFHKILSLIQRYTSGSAEIVGMGSGLILAAAGSSYLLSLATANPAYAAFASTLLNIAKILGMIAAALAIVAGFMKTILNGVEIAEMRHKKEEYQNNIAILKSKITELASLLEQLTEQLRNRFLPMVVEVEGKHPVVSEEKTLFLEEYFQDLESLRQQLSDENNKQSLVELVERLINNESFLSRALMAEIMVSQQRAAALSADTEKVLRMIRKGMSDTEIMEIMKVKEELVSACRCLLVQEGEGKEQENLPSYKIAANEQGEITLLKDVA
ncbi:hypothetical protein [Candidatus Magnetaquicoccus inordinatus]|uniref:hypothetical protein n=1 Tax=Candidatus Magnetaquicoccus inordinatus TaxID=2496818 RepID=UPI00102BBC9E|nr:hypothetical protein [Candidatus Magnetaquicoccus inordinatus]